MEVVQVSEIEIRPAYPELLEGGNFHRLAIDHMAQLLFNSDEESVIQSGMQQLWQQKGNRFSYDNTMVAFVDGQPAAAIACLPLSHLENQTAATFLQISKIQKVQLIPQFLNNYKDLLSMINLDEGGLNEYHVSMLATLESYRGKGLGQKLLTYAEQLALNKNFKHISLTVDVDNVPAQRLYEKQGYQFIGETGQGDYQLYKMRKPLT